MGACLSQPCMCSHTGQQRRSAATCEDSLCKARLSAQTSLAAHPAMVCQLAQHPVSLPPISRLALQTCTV